MSTIVTPNIIQFPFYKFYKHNVNLFFVSHGSESVLTYFTFIEKADRLRDVILEIAAIQLAWLTGFRASNLPTFHFYTENNTLRKFSVPWL